MRQIVMDQKSTEIPQPAVAKVQTDNPTPISLNGFTLKKFVETQEHISKEQLQVVDIEEASKKGGGGRFSHFAPCS